MCHIIWKIFQCSMYQSVVYIIIIYYRHMSHHLENLSGILRLGLGRAMVSCMLCVFWCRSRVGQHSPAGELQTEKIPPISSVFLRYEDHAVMSFKKFNEQWSLEILV